MRYAYPLQSEYYDRQTDKPVSTAKNMFMKQYPTFFRREDVHRDFVHIQRELRDVLPYVRVIKEDIDTSFAHIQFDVAPSDEVLLEKTLLRRGFVKA